MTKRKYNRLSITLKILQDDGAVVTYHRYRKQAIRRLLRLKSGREYTIKVKYGRGLFNEGTYKTKRAVMHAYSQFTKASEVKFILDYNR